MRAVIIIALNNRVNKKRRREGKREIILLKLDTCVTRGTAKPFCFFQ